MSGFVVDVLSGRACLTDPIGNVRLRRFGLKKILGHYFLPLFLEFLL